MPFFISLNILYGMSNKHGLKYEIYRINITKSYIG